RPGLFEVPFLHGVLAGKSLTKTCLDLFGEGPGRARRDDPPRQESCPKRAGADNEVARFRLQLEGSPAFPGGRVPPVETPGTGNRDQVPAVGRESRHTTVLPLDLECAYQLSARYVPESEIATGVDRSDRLPVRGKS